jgi:hypothetical protein
MLLFKKYIVKQEPSYKLNDIGEKYVKLNKIEYEGSLDKLFQTDINKFIAYSKMIYKEWEGFSDDSQVVKQLDLFKYVRKDISREDVNYLLNLEKTGKSNNRLYSSVDEEKINVYLLDLILFADKKLLERLALR